MKHIIVLTSLLFLYGNAALASQFSPALAQSSTQVDSSPRTLFQQHIPFIAEKFIGIPFKLGGRPNRTGTTDNSSLFYTIYSMAAQKSGLTYKAYLPMKYLVESTRQVDPSDVQNGDLIVLNNNLAAMVFQVDPSGKMYFIYASGKRQQVISFNSENLVFQAYWLENLRGFFRLKEGMLFPAH